jgi:hypothetical protein
LGRVDGAAARDGQSPTLERLLLPTVDVRNRVPRLQVRGCAGRGRRRETRTLFAILGLICELAGGLLLSLELVWNVNTVIRPFDWVAKTLLGDTKSGDLKFLVGFGAVGMALFVAVVWTFEPSPDNDWPNLLFLAGVVGFGAALALIFRAFMGWVTDKPEVRTRRLAQIGFVLLLTGFVFQGIVNFMTP